MDQKGDDSFLSNQLQICVSPAGPPKKLFFGRMADVTQKTRVALLDPWRGSPRMILLDDTLNLQHDFEKEIPFDVEKEVITPLPCWITFLTNADGKFIRFLKAGTLAELLDVEDLKGDFKGKRDFEWFSDSTTLYPIYTCNPTAWDPLWASDYVTRNTSTPRYSSVSKWQRAIVKDCYGLSVVRQDIPSPKKNKLTYPKECNSWTSWGMHDIVCLEGVGTETGSFISRKEILPIGNIDFSLQKNGKLELRKVSRQTSEFVCKALFVQRSKS